MTDDRDPELEAFLALLAARRAHRGPWTPTGATSTALRTLLGRPVSEATVDDLERYTAELRADGLSAATLARRTAAARTFFRHLQLIGARERQPGRRGRAAAPHAQAAADALGRRGRAADRGGARARRRAPCATGRSSSCSTAPGLRISEAVGLEKNGVDLDDRAVRVLGKGNKERVVPVGTTGGRGAPPLPRPRPALPRPAPPARALPQRAGRRAHPLRRVPDPAPARRERRPRARARPPPSAPPLVRDASARGRRRPAQRPGDARPRRPEHDRALHARLRPPPPRGLLRRRIRTRGAASDR